jgi:hypothetical protein
MVFVSARVAGPRPSNASEDSVFTSEDSRSVLKTGAVLVASARGHALSIMTERTNRFTA